MFPYHFYPTDRWFSHWEACQKSPIYTVPPGSISYSAIQWSPARAGRSNVWRNKWRKDGCCLRLESWPVALQTNRVDRGHWSYTYSRRYWLSASSNPMSLRRPGKPSNDRISQSFIVRYSSLGQPSRRRRMVIVKVRMGIPSRQSWSSVLTPPLRSMRRRMSCSARFSM